LELTSEASVLQVLDMLSIPVNEDIGMIFVNGKITELDYQLKDGNILSIFPPVVGG